MHSVYNYCFLHIGLIFTAFWVHRYWSLLWKRSNALFENYTRLTNPTVYDNFIVELSFISIIIFTFLLIILLLKMFSNMVLFITFIMFKGWYRFELRCFNVFYDIIMSCTWSSLVYISMEDVNSHVQLTS